MALVEFSGLAFGYSDDQVITDASGALHAGNVIGLVGANGGGKTTLVRLLLGELSPERGHIQRARQSALAYVSQGSLGDDQAPLFEFVRAGREDLLTLEREIAALHQLLAGAEDSAALARLGRAAERFQALGGHRWPHETERLLLGLSFSRNDFPRPLATLSGGQRQKACLARALLSQAPCLVFDEPTNHLDLEAQAFFAAYVRNLPRETGVLLVSHDRWLLDALATHVWELDDGVLYRYKGSYTQYVPARDLRRQQQQEAFQRQQEQIARTEEYIRRNIAGQNTRQAQGRRTRLARMERMERPGADPEMSFVLKPALRSGDQLLLVENLAFTYRREGEPGEPAAAPAVHVQAGPSGLDLNPPLPVARGQVAEQPLLSGMGFTLFRGERLGIVGPNGCGKTTLLKLLTKALPPVRGLVAWGSNAELGVFSQDSADLGSGGDPLGELRLVEPGISDSAARDYLARFGFSGDMVFAPVHTLSGGERSRLSLAKIFRSRPNVLLLDEPTNHLDIYAREALEQFLGAFEGSVILVTHDRALLERICDRLVAFTRDGAGTMTAEFFRGAYSDYLTWRDSRAAKAQPADPAGAESAAQGPRTAPRLAGGAGLRWEEVAELARQAHMSPQAYRGKQRERVGKRLEQLEAEVAAAEAQAAALATEQRDADQRGEYERVMALHTAVEELQVAIEAKLDELAQAGEEFEEWDRLEEPAS